MVLLVLLLLLHVDVRYRLLRDYIKIKQKQGGQILGPLEAEKMGFCYFRASSKALRSRYIQDCRISNRIYVFNEIVSRMHPHPQTLLVGYKI